VNASTGYSPFEVVFTQRPKFPLVHLTQSLRSLPKDMDSFMEQKIAQLEQIRSDVAQNLTKAKENMLARENENKGMSVFHPGDYVYLCDETTGAARKLRNHYTGPYVVDSVVSAHMVVLKDQLEKKQFPQPIHIDRLKVAHVRQPTPSNFFKVITKVPEKQVSCQSTQTDFWEISGTPDMPVVPLKCDVQVVDDVIPPNTRPKRVIQKPIRYRDSDHMDPDMLDQEISLSDSGGRQKIKRFLAERHTPNGLQYLVQIVGEPAQNAPWVPSTSLNAKAKLIVLSKPPPFV
jgi:hypothetical protein